MPFGESVFLVPRHQTYKDGVWVYKILKKSGKYEYAVFSICYTFDTLGIP